MKYPKKAARKYDRTFERVKKGVGKLGSLGADVVLIARRADGHYSKPIATSGFQKLVTDGHLDLKTFEAVHHLSSRQEEAAALQYSKQPPPAFGTFPLPWRRAVVAKLVDKLVPGRKHYYPFDPNGNGSNELAVAATATEVYKLFVEGDPERDLPAHPWFTVTWPRRGFSNMPSNDVNTLFNTMVEKVRLVLGRGPWAVPCDAVLEIHGCGLPSVVATLRGVQEGGSRCYTCYLSIAMT